MTECGVNYVPLMIIQRINKVEQVQAMKHTTYDSHAKTSAKLSR